jgi:hypothetical protein
MCSTNTTCFLLQKFKKLIDHNESECGHVCEYVARGTSISQSFHTTRLQEYTKKSMNV